MKILQEDGSLTESRRWRCVENGRMLTSDLVETIASQLDEKSAGDCRVIGPNRILGAVQYNDLTGVSEALRSKANVTFPMVLPDTRHYVQVEHEHGSQHLILGDPLFHNVRQDGTLELPLEYQLHLGRIIRIFREHGRKVSDEVLLKRVPIQVAGSNDCGPYTLRSCTVTALRVPDYDRLEISRRHLQDLQDDSRFGAVPRVRFVVPDQVIEKKKCPGGCNNGGEKLLPGSCWCPNCHPVLDPPSTLLGRCSHTAKGKSCQVNRIPVIGCEHCWNHCNLAEVENIKSVVSERLQLKGHPLPGEEETPLRSAELEKEAIIPDEHPSRDDESTSTQEQPCKNDTKPRCKPAMSTKKLLAQLSMGSGRKDRSPTNTFEIEFQYQDLRGLNNPKRVWIELLQKPSWVSRGRGRIQTADALITARYCEFCQAWHESPKDKDGNYLIVEENTITLPDPELTFYSCEKVDRKVSKAHKKGVPLTREMGFSPECHLDDDELGSDIDDGESYYDSGHPDVMSANAREQMQPASGYQGVASTSASYTVRRFREWKIVDKKPDRVPLIEWAALSSSTRRNHIKILHEIQQLPFKENNTALPDAIVNMVLERGCSRGWRWSTAATYLSSCASACRDLTFYTDANEGIQLDKSHSFKTALSQACKLAKTSLGEPVKSRAFTMEEFNRLSEALKETEAWYLLQLTWYIAGRIGDVRRLVPQCIYIDLESAADDQQYVTVKAKFVEGKGAAFWGPYTITTSMPREVAQQLSEYLRDKPVDSHAFTVRHQSAVSKAIAKLYPDHHSVRSLRRGRLVTLADQGMTDLDLQQLSGHKKKSTLMRYLGWGHHSCDGKRTAKEAARADEAAVKKVLGGAATDVKGMWAGANSGLRGVAGKRRQETPQLFSAKAPSRSECGLPSDGDEDTSDWIVHAPDFKNCLQSHAILDAAQAPDLKQAMEQTEEYRTGSSHYGDTGPPLTPDQIPLAKFAPFAVRQMLQNNLISPFDLESMQIKSGCNAFLNAEPHKKRWRIITETLFNRTLDKSRLPPLEYPSGREVAANVANKKYAIEFDFKGYYFQILLGDNKEYYVIRTKEPIYWEGQYHNLFVFNKMPMGGAHSAHVAQTSTWCLLEPVMEMDVYTATMIDNVLIAADDPKEFVKAVKTFLSQCDKFSATVNKRESYDVSDAAILQKGRDFYNAKAGKDANERSVFLGVAYQGNKVGNSEKNLKKLRDAYERLQQASSNPQDVKVTRRQLASIISLCAWMAYVLQIPLCHHGGVLRLFSMLEQKSGSWDDHVVIEHRTLNTLRPLVQQILDNFLVEPYCPEVPADNDGKVLPASHYDIVIICDAYLKGWGGYVWIDKDMYEVKQGWALENKYSAHAEPQAAMSILQWAKRMYREKFGSKARPSVALVTDHEAIPQRQRRPISGRGGFSPAYHLNQFYRELYGEDGRNNGQVFYVEGHRNVADAVSRKPEIGDPLTWDYIVDRRLPNLDQFTHPYKRPKELDRKWWCR